MIQTTPIFSSNLTNALFIIDEMNKVPTVREQDTKEHDAVEVVGKSIRDVLMLVAIIAMYIVDWRQCIEYVSRCTLDT